MEESLNLKDDLLFKRRDNKVETGKRISTDDRNKLEFIMSLTNENSLLLSKCSQFNIGFTDNAYNWFNEKLCPIRADSLILLSPDKMKGALEKHGSKIISMLNQADFGISDIIMKGTNAEMSLEKSMMLIEKTGPYAVEYEISLPQGCSKKYSIQLEHESAGTKKILGLIISWISALEKGKVLLIDGFESGLHPLLVDFMIGHFYEKDLNKNRAQLILTTYDAALAKRNGFRRDQVWFTARDQAVGTTSLYSWLDYDVRSDLEFTENYLAGRFGAVPNINKSEK